MPVLSKCLILCFKIILLRYIVTSIQHFLKYPNLKLTNIAYLISIFDNNDYEKLNDIDQIAKIDENSV